MATNGIEPFVCIFPIQTQRSCHKACPSQCKWFQCSFQFSFCMSGWVRSTHCVRCQWAHRLTEQKRCSHWLRINSMLFVIVPVRCSCSIAFQLASNFEEGQNNSTLNQTRARGEGGFFLTIFGAQCSELYLRVERVFIHLTTSPPLQWIEFQKLQEFVPPLNTKITQGAVSKWFPILIYPLSWCP